MVIVQVSTEAAMYGLHRGAPGLVKILDRHADSRNVPRLGVYHNTAFSAAQLNFAHAVKGGSGTML
jgi:hypothetical protein